MRWFAAAVIVLALLGGCATYQGSRKVAVTAGVTTLVSAVVGIGALFIAASTIGDGAASFTCGGSSTCEVAATIGFLGIITTPVAAVTALGGAIGMDIYDKPRREQPRRSANDKAVHSEPAKLARNRAWTITQDAARAARAGDCSTVVVQDHVVLELDVDFHDTVFIGDVAIKRCLDAARGDESQ